MPIAAELTIDNTATALDLAQNIFGSGVVVNSATITGDGLQSGIYSGADVTLGDLSVSDTGIILSTGNVADFTNSSGTTNTNTDAGVSTGYNGAGDAQLDAITGQLTEDAVVLEANFTPTGDYITMQFLFSSEEYLEFVSSGVNDAFGVWVNGTYAPFTPAPSDLVSIDTINTTASSNLYVDNPDLSDPFNTEMDGATIALSIKAPVNTGVANTIKIAIADGGDDEYDSNVLIAANSVQTIALAFDNSVDMLPNSSITVDVLANDIDQTGSGLSIVEINGTAIVPGATVTLPSGEDVTLNLDGTLTIDNDGDIGEEAFTYKVIDGAGNTDVGFISINTTNTPLNYIVEGDAGDNLIDASYVGDPEGDQIDNGDDLNGSNDDVVVGGDGDDTILAGLGDDLIDAGDDDDSVSGGAGNDTIVAGAGDDSVYGGSGDDFISASSGMDTLEGGLGQDTIHGGENADLISGGDGDDVLFVGQGDTVTGGDGDDLFNIVSLGEIATNAITVTGGEGDETDGDTLNLNGLHVAGSLKLTDPDDVNGGLSGSVLLLDGTVVNFSNIENIICFVAGTEIATPYGGRAIESLKIGDDVITQDNGIQKIRWIGTTTVPAMDKFAPIKFKKGTFLGSKGDLIVSPQHRMLFKGYEAELLFGTNEVLVPAIHLVDDNSVVRNPMETVTYVHILFEQHEIIFAQGVATESFHPGSYSVDALAPKAQAELFELFPDLRSDISNYGHCARMSLKAVEAKALMHF
ncbi:choice-of-anchor L domain-containing protein [Planktotalea sp.]|uniref:choice-of-anchor L domain-containing protein n=1 Tax=Planktotalea sp. TaxID=2029877 RepID=UPI003D6ACF32